MNNAFVTNLVLILINVVLGSVGQISLKYGASQLGKGHAAAAATGLVGALKGMFTPYILLGLALYAVSAVIWIRILKQVNLSFAYPMISLSYVVVVLLSVKFFGEKLSPLMISGLALVCFGVSLIGMGYNTVK
jgi:multidrug transporter EmrE-like cation transporter